MRYKYEADAFGGIHLMERGKPSFEYLEPGEEAELFMASVAEILDWKPEQADLLIDALISDYKDM